MANIAVDIDSTLYDFETPAREAFLRLAAERDDKELVKGAYVAWSEWRSPADVCGIPAWLDAIAICHDADAILAQKPFAGAVETCQALRDEGHHLLYISNRASEATDATTQWLGEQGFLGKNTEILALMGDKRPHMSKCQYLIDDRPKTVVEFVYDYDWTYHRVAGRIALGYEPQERKAFVKAYQYNQALTDVPGLYLAPTWAGLNRYLVSKGVLSEPAVQPALTV